MNKLQPTVIPAGAMLAAVTAVAVVWGALAAAAAVSGITEFIRLISAVSLAVLFAAAAAFLDFDIWKRFAPAAGVAMLVILFAVAVWGVEKNGMRGWFDLGAFTVQPSEIAKPFLAIALSVLFLSGEREKRRAGMFLGGGVVAAIAMEPDFGTLAIFIAGGFFAAFLAGTALKYLLVAWVVTLAGAACYVLSVRYAVVRISEFFSGGDISEAPWHWRQMQIAAARGGWGGTGSDGAWWSSEFLPLAHNDSIYSVIAEGAGTGGAILVSLLWCFWAAAAAGLALKTQDLCRKVCIGTLGGMIVFQAGIHIAANTGLLPITGINLPFMSYGGSSMVASGIMVGIMFSAARESKGGKGVNVTQEV